MNCRRCSRFADTPLSYRVGWSDDRGIVLSPCLQLAVLEFAHQICHPRRPKVQQDDCEQDQGPQLLKKKKVETMYILGYPQVGSQSRAPSFFPGSTPGKLALNAYSLISGVLIWSVVFKLCPTLSEMFYLGALVTDDVWDKFKYVLF